MLVSEAQVIIAEAQSQFQAQKSEANPYPNLDGYGLPLLELGGTVFHKLKDCTNPDTYLLANCLEISTPVGGGEYETKQYSLEHLRQLSLEQLAGVLNTFA